MRERLRHSSVFARDADSARAAALFILLHLSPWLLRSRKSNVTYVSATQQTQQWRVQQSFWLFYSLCFFVVVIVKKKENRPRQIYLLA